MPCLHPVQTVYRDFRLKKVFQLDVPCGKCLCCRNSFRRSWQFRIGKTAESVDGFIYDTLTISPEKCRYLDYHEICEDGALCIPGEYFDDGLERIRSIPSDVQRELEYYDFRVPFFTKKDVSSWIKHGRERYNSFYRKDIESGKRKRLKIRYVCVSEYGPLHGRIHVHLMMFGIAYEDYVRFFQQYWHFQWGFTKTKWVSNKEGRKSASCISRYLAKYFVKGVGAHPFEKFGIVPRAWRLLSHGIGEEYLKSGRISNLGRYLHLDPKIWQLLYDTSFHDCDPKVRRNLVGILELALQELSVSDVLDFTDALMLAYDNAFPLSLPRYYKSKLLNERKQSIAYVVCSSYILEYSRKSECKRIVAYWQVFHPERKIDSLETAFESDSSQYYLWRDEYRAYVRGLAKFKAHNFAKMERNLELRALRALNFDELAI